MEQVLTEPTQTDDKEILDAMKLHKPSLPVGGHLSRFRKHWLSITSDPSVLDIVSGMHIDLTDLPKQKVQPHPFKLSEEELQAGDVHIQSLLQKRAIIQC